MADKGHYDFLVIGGGSGGIASARRAAMYGAKVAVVEAKDLGGTCVNVGCVPKKIMWNAATMHEMVHEAKHHGTSVQNIDFDWESLVTAREDYITKLNGIYEKNLKNSGVEYIAGMAEFDGANKVKVGSDEYTADHILIAVGGTPSFPPIEGAKEHAISSDGFFGLKTQPKKVAVIGAGYIAVELAGVFSALHTDTTLVIRHEQAMRTLDDMLREELHISLKRIGVKLATNSTPEKITKESDSTLTLHLKDGEKLTGFNKILIAIGRKPMTDTLNLDSIGLDLEEKGHVIVDDYQNTNVPGVYALGDVCDKHVDLTPMAINAGRKLADRLFGGKPDAKADYKNVPTVIFSHPPMATIGYTEEAARKEHGDENIKIYKSRFTNMWYGPWKIDADEKPKTAMKVVCLGPDEKVIGLHIQGMAADEIMQGFAVAIKMGCTKSQFDDCVAIHPTAGEELVTMPPWGQPHKDYKYKRPQ